MASIPGIKLLIVGDGGVGKSCLFITYTTNVFPAEYVPTVFDNYSGYIFIDGKPVNVAFWDTAGQEDYDRLRPLSYPQTDIFMLAFSVGNYDSFDNIRTKFYPEVTHFCPKVPVVLVGCKSDLRSTEPARLGSSHRMVTHKEASDFAKTLRTVYLETSSLTQAGLKECFDQAIRRGLNYATRTPQTKGLFHFGGSKKEKEIPIPPVMPPAGKAPWITVETSSFADDWFKVLQDPRFYDVSFMMENGRRLDAHKIVLCSASKFFSRLFCSSAGAGAMTVQERQIAAIEGFTQQDLNSGLVEGIAAVQDEEDLQKPTTKRKTTVVLSEDIKPATFLHVLEFLYTGVPRIPEDASEEEVKDMSRVARIFKLSQLETICHNIQNDEEFLNPSIGTFLNDETGAVMKKRFFNQREYADVTFNVMGTSLYAHRVVLTARSEVMAAMFSGHFREGDDQKTVEVNVGGTTVDNFLALLEYLYTDHAPIEEGDGVGILVLADEYCVKRLCNLCELYVTKEVDRQCSKRIQRSEIDVIGLLSTAQIYNATQLVNWCLHFISTNYIAFEKRAEFSVLTNEHRKFVDENRWPPLSYLEELAEYERKTKRSSDMCNLM